MPIAKRKSWARIASERKRALSELIDALCECSNFEVEAGCSGDGPLVRACRSIGKRQPAELRAWLKDEEDFVEAA